MFYGAFSRRSIERNSKMKSSILKVDLLNFHCGHVFIVFRPQANIWGVIGYYINYGLPTGERLIEMLSFYIYALSFLKILAQTYKIYLP